MSPTFKRTLIAMLAIAAITGAEGTQAQSASTPEVAALLRMERAYKAPFMLDPRVLAAGEQRGGGEFAGRRDPAFTEAIAASVGAVVAEFESVRVCGAGDPARGIPPYATCKLVGAETFIAMAEARITGGSAEVDVVVWNNTPTNHVHPVSGRHIVVSLTRSGGQWHVEGIRYLAVT